MQSLTKLTSIALLWWAAVFFAAISWWPFTGAAVVLLTLFTLRVFALMHRECGHASLFQKPTAQSRHRLCAGSPVRHATVCVVAAP